MCPHLESLILTNNKISKFEEINKIAATCATLLRFSLLGNIVTQLPNYRMYVIFKMPNLRVLDFQKVTLKERIAAKKLFESAAGAVALKEISLREGDIEANIKKDKKLVGQKRTEAEQVSEEQLVLRIAEIEKLIENATSLEEMQDL